MSMDPALRLEQRTDGAGSRLLYRPHRVLYPEMSQLRGY